MNGRMNWTKEQARHHYNIPYWSEGYFDVNQSGQLVVCPTSDRQGIQFTLSSICHELSEKGIKPPVLLRFLNILQNRVRSLCDSFNDAISDVEYQGSFTVCYPIKVNQQRRVVEGLLEANNQMSTSQVGLEAGSKTELLAVIAMSEKTNSVIVCNGYKDQEYLRAALIATKLGHKVFIVIEKLTELDLLLGEAEKLNVKPAIGVRARLASKAESKWQDSGGEHSKFGLSASQILRLIDKLKLTKNTESFQLLHFHLGSQITSIRDIQNGLQECAQFYAELRQMQIPISTVDVGGGLGVDYEGTRSQSHCSVNYTLNEYANNVVQAFHRISEERGMPHPALITESGRALTAHHAVLVTNVVDSEAPRALEPNEPMQDSHPKVNELWSCYSATVSTQDNDLVFESFHKAEHLLGQVQEMFSYGVISLPERALAERIHRNILFAVKEKINADPQTRNDLRDELQVKLASKFFVNFSIFQSLPDAWAIDQLFPILPLEDLDKFPSEAAIIQDITCDSDGVIKHYINAGSVSPVIELPAFNEQHNYLLGFFMIGAYQEILGDMHNLFGDTHTVDLAVNESKELKVVTSEQGSSAEELLEYVDFSATKLLESFRRQLKGTDISTAEQRKFLAELRQGIYGYSYLED